MKAVVFHAVGDFRLEDVAEPKIQEPTDAVVRITASAICGTILDHEGVSRRSPTCISYVARSPEWSLARLAGT
jgi:hypothetical protein